MLNNVYEAGEAAAAAAAADVDADDDDGDVDDCAGLPLLTKTKK